jgi:hypothetical protein
MKRLSKVLMGAALMVLTTGDAAAQWNVARFDTQRNRVYTTAGVDPALVTSLGYGRVVSVLDHDFQVTVDGGIVMAGVDASDFRARLGTQTTILGGEWLRVTGSATFITRGTDNVIYRGLNFGADITGTFGVYRPGWFAAGEFGKDKAIITHVTHSDWYREHHYADAKDGWYLDAGGTYHFGAAAGLAIGRTELVGRFGFHRTEDFKDLSPPVYFSLGVGVGF